MRIYLLLPFLAGLGMTANSLAQNVGIGTPSPDTSAQLDVTSTSRGLLIPRMVSAGVTAIGTPAKGLMVYDSSRNQLLINTGSASAPYWQNIEATGAWSLTGNTSINRSTQFLGTTDFNPLVFRTNGIFSGEIDYLNQNTFFGYQCGLNNTAYGNSAMGANSMMSNTTGNENAAFGAASLQQNTTGSYNTALGFGSLQANVAGQYNTAVGLGALSTATSPNYSTAAGEQALQNSSGIGNTAAGYAALSKTTDSYYNTAIGANAGAYYNFGYNNVFLGANCYASGAGIYNAIAIGQGVLCTASSQARIGNSVTNSIGGYAYWTNFSDGRYKKNIKENVKGTDFIMRLRPITYQLDVTGIENKLSEMRGKTTDGGLQNAAMGKAIAEKEATVFSGFVAQEVEQAAKDASYDFSGVDKPKNENDFYGLRYEDLVVPLVKTLQEQQRLIKILQQKIDRLKKTLQNDKTDRS